MLEPVEILAPDTWEQALAMKAAQPEAVPIAGGTDLMVALNFDRARPPAILDLTRVPELRDWEADDGRLRIGAGVTYTRLIEELGERLPGLAIASRTVGSPQIRNRGTVGGNLGTASPAGDGLPPLYVSDAEVELASATGTRRLPVADFVTGPKRQAAREDELIAAFHLPAATGAAAVREDRHPQRDGHRRLLALAGHLARAPGGLCVHRVGRPDADPRRRGRGVHRRRARRGGAVGGARAAGGRGPGALRRARRGGGRADRRRPRQRRLPPARARRPRAAHADVGVGGAAVRLTLTVNGERREADGVWEGESLLMALRDHLDLPGSKNACEQGECGSCSVYLDGELVCACLVLAGQAEGREVVTVEGLAAGDDLHAVQEAFVEAGAVQCGFCTPGLIVASHDLLARNAAPSDAEIREALAGNLCRCTGYEKILDAVRLAAGRLRRAA